MIADGLEVHIVCCDYSFCFKAGYQQLSDSLRLLVKKISLTDR